MLMVSGALFLLPSPEIPDAMAADTEPASQRPRAREIGIRIGILPTGKWNAITDVPSVQVGHETVIIGDDIRSGVTVVLPHADGLFQNKVPCAIVAGNGFGKFVGVTQVTELGVLESPVGLTNTLSTFAVAEAIVRYTLHQPGNETVRSVNPVVGECNDGSLNNIRAMQIDDRHFQRALAAAVSGPVAEGSVGAGTGTRCMGWKGGIGTSSRVVPENLGGYVVGVLAQTNFDGVLSIAGAPVGQQLERYFLKQELNASQKNLNPAVEDRGSCVLVVATDAPLDARQLRRLAQRALLGLAAVGSPMTHGSGDYAIAFSSSDQVRVPHEPSSALQQRTLLADERLSPLFLAAKESAEEAIINSLLRATTVSGYQGRTAEAIPIEQVVRICRQYSVILDEK